MTGLLAAGDYRCLVRRCSGLSLLLAAASLGSGRQAFAEVWLGDWRHLFVDMSERFRLL
jgi:hypothetical protein